MLTRQKSTGSQRWKGGNATWLSKSFKRNRGAAAGFRACRFFALVIKLPCPIRDSGTMAKIGRNEACPCGSGKKYKKCHLDAPKVPPPEFVREMMLDTQRRIEREKFSGPPSMKFPLGPDQVGRIIWNALHIRPKTETFHEFIINVLKWTVGPAWYEEQVGLSPEKRHVIAQWCNAFALLQFSST